MKIIIMKYILVICFVFVVVGCTKENSTNYTVISGKIINHSAGKNLILDNGFEEKVFKVNSDGTFKDTIEIPFPRYYSINYNYNRILLYINPNQEILINFDENNLDESLTFLGNNKHINQYLKVSNIKEKEIDKIKMYNLNPEEFELTINKFKNKLDSILAINNMISKEFREVEVKRLNYNYLYEINNFIDFYSIMKNAIAPQHLIKKVNSIFYSNERDYLLYLKYRTLTREHYNKKVKSLNFNDENSDEQIALIDLIADIKSEIIKNDILFYNAMKMKGIKETNNLQTYYDKFMITSSNNSHKAQLTKLYEKLKPLSPNSPSPKFYDYKNYNGGSTSFDELLGKYIYIDIWATWCAPCIREVPFLKKLMHHFKNNNIVFVSISIDKSKDENKWKDKIEELELGGFQLLANNEFHSEFIQNYAINSIPRYILIDPQGKIINANAPRPSDTKLMEKLEKLLN